MADLQLRISEGNEPQPKLLWDSVWHPNEGVADWAPAGNETLNVGGLRAQQALHTAVILALFTDVQMPEGHPLAYLVEDGDRRGYWGDGIDVRDDLGEAALGSLLWIFERAPLTEEIRRWVEVVALEALAPLKKQGIAARIEVQAYAQQAFNRLDLHIQIYGRDGAQIYDQKFADLWAQTASAPKSPAFAPE